MGCLREGDSRGHTGLRPNALLLSLGLTAGGGKGQKQEGEMNPRLHVISMHTAERYSNEVSVFKRQVIPIKRSSPAIISNTTTSG